MTPSTSLNIRLFVGNVHPVMRAGSKELDKLRHALIQTISDFLNRRLPLRRIILVASIFKDCSIELPTTDILVRRLLKEQHKDGGWVDCEDTAWSLFYINENMHKKRVIDGLSWLEGERKEKKGWGFCKRDHPNIPITGQILYLLPEINSHIEAAKWLENQWEKDIESYVKLDYKGAWYVLAYTRLFEKVQLSKELFEKTVQYLLKEQRNDGSWGPWRKHPAGDDFYSTGVSMTALALSYNVTGNRKIYAALSKSIKWIKNNQLENGLLPTHYIEEGSAWIFWGWSKALSLLDI